MQKMEYCRPAADLILFENEDVIMASKPGEGDKPEGACPNNGTHWHCSLWWGGNWCDEERCESITWRFWHEVIPGAPYSLDDDQYSGAETFDNTEDFDDFGGWSD